MPTKLGLVFHPILPPESLRAVAAGVEAAGLDEFWVSEDCFKESGVASAMEIATVDRLFPGRFAACIGHGVQPWMAQAGVQADAPLALLREYAQALRRLLAGERVSVSGRYVRLEDVALEYPPAQARFMIGVAGPRSLAAAGELGDGTVLALGLDVEGVRAACEATLATAGARQGCHEVVATLTGATGLGSRERVDRELAAWGMTGGPDVGLAGSAADFADRIRALAGSGVTSVAVQPTRDEPDLEVFARFLGEEVRPLLD
jgi:5,10-methylenetetrahydromethanopterin reductase